MKKQMVCWGQEALGVTGKQKCQQIPVHSRAEFVQLHGCPPWVLGFTLRILAGCLVCRQTHVSISNGLEVRGPGLSSPGFLLEPLSERTMNACLG